MTKPLKSTQQEISLADYTQQIFEQMPEVAGNEKDYKVSGNMITIIFGSEYGDFKLSILVTKEDTSESIHQRFVQLLTDHINDQQDFDQWANDNYEHASHTQGYAFDSLTL